MADKRFAVILESDDWNKGGTKLEYYYKKSLPYVQILTMILLTVAFVIVFIEFENSLLISVILSAIASVLAGLFIFNSYLYSLLFILSIALAFRWLNDPTIEILRRITIVLAGFAVFGSYEKYKKYILNI